VRASFQGDLEGKRVGYTVGYTENIGRGARKTYQLGK
jgi:hypothetical protein